MKFVIDNTQLNLRLYHWVLSKLPAEFTEEDALQIVQQRRALTRASKEETKSVLAKMRKLRMIGSDNIQNTYQKTVYYVEDLYCQHYKKGKHAPDYKELETLKEAELE